MNELENILKNIEEKQLKRLITKIKETHEYDVLSEKTQIKNSAVEDKIHDGHLTNRQTHTYQVSEVAYTMVKTSGMSEKEALVAKLVGLCHDLGHTPFGHDGEEFFKEKTGKRFSHAKYGAQIFDKIFDEILSSKNNKTGKELFDEETKESFEELRNYIKAGVNFHQDCYYIFKLDKQLERTDSKDQELLEKAIKNPCIQAGMLADTVAFMQSDVRDLLTAENPFDPSKTVISIEDQVEVAKKIGFTPESIKTMQEQLLRVGQIVDTDGLNKEEALKKVLETIGNMNIIQIQGLMATNIGKQGLNKDGRFESIPDEYKLLLDNNEAGYKELIEFRPKKTYIDNWETFRNQELAKQREALMLKNPLLCLTYEIQNDLIYGKILKPEHIKLLNNDIENNKAIFSRVYDYLYEITDKPSSELRNDEIENRKEIMKIYKQGKYPKQFDEKTKEDKVKNLVIFKMQQMGNQELKDFYQEKVASRERGEEVEIDTEQKVDMASFEWSQGEYFEVDMEVLMRNALAYMNITTEDVSRAENAEQTIRNQDKVLEGVNQR